MNQEGLLEIFDLKGEKFCNIKLPSNNTVQEIELSLPTTGLFQCIIRSGMENAGRKVLVIE